MSFTTEVWSAKPSTAAPKKTAMPSSALPRTGELREEDDWTKVKDPKEKKRIQNRVAQRTYRHRMKARLGELQARLESHEGRRSSETPSELGPSTPNHYTPKSDAMRMDSSPSPSMLDHAQHQHHQQQQHHHQPQPQQPLPQLMGQPNLYEQPVEDPENSIFTQHALAHSPATSQASPLANGLLSPPVHPDQAQTQPYVECMPFQGMPAYPHTSQVHNPMMPFAPTATDGMDFAFDPSAVDMWKAETPVKMQQHASPDSTGYYHTMTPPATASTVATTSAAAAGAAGPQQQQQQQSQTQQQPPIRTTSKDAPLDERFEAILNQVEAAGFDNFDQMATAYYAQTLHAASPVAAEQRQSRGRRLPQLIAGVHASSAGWSDWERKGFHEEVLRTAEGMLAAEGGDAARARLAGHVGALAEAVDGSGNANSDARDGLLLDMKAAVQEAAPNSWSMAMAMASEKRPSWQADRSSTALATTLLLQYAGRMPNDQLLRLVGACL